VASGNDPRLAMLALPESMIRIYFNRHEDAPQVWSVDEGSVETEICVQKIFPS
jgi:hypothetical protein